MKKTLLWVGTIFIISPFPLPLVFGMYFDNLFNSQPVFTILFLLMYLVGWVCVFWGCYLWTKEKNRHWVYTLWGLLAPVGYLGIALLENKRIVVRD